MGRSRHDARGAQGPLSSARTATSRGAGRMLGALLTLGGLLGGLPGAAHAAFEELITGARPQAMGGAFVALADDANALYWNPAGLPQLHTGELTLMHSDEYDISVGPQLKTDFVGFVNWPMDMGTFGLSYFKRGASSVLEESALTLSAGFEVAEGASLGLNVKYLRLESGGKQIDIDDPALQAQNTISFDLGGLYRVTDRWKLGFLARNLAGQFGAVLSDELKKTYRVGSAYRFQDVLFLGDAITWTVDVFTTEDVEDRAGTRAYASSGVEFDYEERFAVRVGANKGRLTAGLGLAHPPAGISVDYAFAKDDPGDTHRLSATYRFGGPPTDTHIVHHVRPPSPDEPPRDRGGDHRDHVREAPARRSQPAQPAPAAATPKREASISTDRLDQELVGAPVIGRGKTKVDLDKELEEFLNP